LNGLGGIFIQTEIKLINLIVNVDEGNGISKNILNIITKLIKVM